MTTTRVPLAIIGLLVGVAVLAPGTASRVRIPSGEASFSTSRRGARSTKVSPDGLHHHVFQHFGDHARLEGRLHAAGWYSGRRAGQQRGARRGRWRQGRWPLCARLGDWPGALHILGWDRTLRPVPPGLKCLHRDTTAMTGTGAGRPDISSRRVADPRDRSDGK